MSVRIHIPRTGGKAGYGNNKTSSIQVRLHNCIIKQFRYNVGVNFDEVHERAKKFATELAQRQEGKFNSP